MACISAHSNSFQYADRNHRSADFDRRLYRNHIIDFYRKRKCMGPHLDDPVQYSVWHYLMEISLLG